MTLDDRDTWLTVSGVFMGAELESGIRPTRPRAGPGGGVLEPRPPAVAYRRYIKIGGAERPRF